MDAIPVVVKHQGKKHDVELDPTSTGETFKYQLYSLTGVEPDRQKILIKGGQLKDDTDLSTLGAKPGQVFMMMGTPAPGGEGSGAVARPKAAIRFVEDMTEAEQARAEGATPAGLQNLGNTCYLNSTLQTLRSVPELQAELAQYAGAAAGGAGGGPSAATYRQFGLEGLGGPTQDLAASLRDLYRHMAETQEGFPPLVFLQTLRTVFPQFAQKAKDGRGYAQQDAEEAWSQIVATLRDKLTIQDAADGATSGGAGASAAKPSFVDKYMAGSFETSVTCDEAAAAEAGEQPVESREGFFKLDCHISKETNHLHDGIMAGLEEQIEKKSAALDREAVYTKRARVARLPKYLTVHFVRFFWKREAQKKAKIMRKVTFPAELDTVDYCTDALRKRLIPVRDKLREIRKDEEDMVRARKRQKFAHQQEVDRAADPSAPAAQEPVQKAKAKEEEKEKKEKKSKGEKVDEKPEEETYKTDAEYEAERATALRTATEELHALVDPDLAGDAGANASGLYELRGVVTHQGASADSGHYTAYVKKQGAVDAATGKRKEDDGKWWWFNDDKVSEVGAEKIETLAGGGESHSALILLYRAVELPTVEEVQE